MNTPSDPWNRPVEEPPPERPRVWLWLGFLAAVGVIVLALARTFPEALRTGDDTARVIYSLGFLVLVSTGLLRASRGRIAEHLKYGAIWAGIIAVLVVGYAYRDEMAGVGRKVQLAFNVGTPVATGEHELVVPQDETGHFVVDARVNGQRVRFMVDTGATDTVLSPDDARRLGVDVDGLDYAYAAETANGVGYGAAWRADSLEVGPIRLDGFPMSVNKAPMSGSLLGMSFLGRLEAFEFRGRKLILKWREDPA